MEDVAIVNSSRPTGSVIVNDTVQDANFYGEPSSTRPVENATIFFKHAIGTLSSASSDERGKLLLTIDLDFQHGETLRQRKHNYAFNQYREVKLTGKRTDIIFGRSGSIGVLYTTNPWYQLSDTDPAQNAVAAASDPTYRIVTISDHLEIDIWKNVKDMIRANNWFFANPGDGMPKDYYKAGRIFILTESPPQLLDYQIPLYLVGTIAVRDYIPTDLAALTYSKVRVDHPFAMVKLEWDTKVNEFVVNAYTTQPLGDFTSVGQFVPDEPSNFSITIQAKPDGEEPELNLPVATEVHAVSDFPTNIVASDTGAMYTFRTTVTKLSNFLDPELVSHNITYVVGHAVFEDLSSPEYRTYRGVPLDSMRNGVQSMPRERALRLGGVRAFANIARVAREQMPTVVTRPVGDDVMNVTRQIQRLQG